MSETEKTNSTEETKKPKKGKLLIIVGLIVFLLAGAGGGFYFWKSSAAVEKVETESKGKEKKSTSKKSSGEKEEIEESDKTDSLENALPDDADVKNVVELQPFIVNLADSETPRYLRLSVSLGIGEEGGEKPDPLFLTRVKNAMLAVLTTKKSDDVLTVEGKAKLRKELLKAAQAASEKPHVEAIYITDFIVQM